MAFFEDWDDVGINVAKPPDLLRIYRELGHYRSSGGAELCDSGTCTDTELVISVPAVEQLRLTLETRISQLNEQICVLESENAQLLRAVEQNSNRERPLGSTPVVSPIKSTDRTETHREISSVSVVDVSETASADDKRLISDELQNSDISAGPSYKHLEENYETAVEEISRSNPMLSFVGDDGDDLPVTESVVVSSPSTVQADNSDKTPCRTSAAFRRLLLDSVFHVLPPDSRIFGEVSHIAELGEDAVVQMVPLLARCLPHVVPGVLLAARDELIPLIVAAAALHSESSTRDHLLNLLFNLIKRPDVDQRRMILVGCTAFARHAGAARVETELLPQCWEQLAHRYVERRLLVAEACGALTPHIAPALRGSLLLSMLQQMLDDSVEDVREAAVRSLGVVAAFIDDDDKYQLTESLLFATLLTDSSDRVLDALRTIFLPSLAVWAMNIGRLESSLLSLFVDRVEKTVDPTKSDGSSPAGIRLTESRHFTLLIATLTDLLPVVFCSFLLTGPFATVSDDSNASDIHYSAARILPKPAIELLSVSLLVGGEDHLNDLLCRYEDYVDAEWYHPWPTHNWVASELVSRLVLVCEMLDPAEQTTLHILAVFFRTLCHTFGPSFTQVGWLVGWLN